MTLFRRRNTDEDERLGAFIIVILNEGTHVAVETGFVQTRRISVPRGFVARGNTAVSPVLDTIGKGCPYPLLCRALRVIGNNPQPCVVKTLPCRVNNGFSQSFPSIQREQRTCQSWHTFL